MTTHDQMEGVRQLIDVLEPIIDWRGLGEEAAPGLASFTGAEAASLAVTDGDDLLTISSAGYPAEIIDRFRRVPLAGPYPMTDCVRLARPVELTDESAWRVNYLHLETLGTRPTAALPVMAEGKPLGALSLSFDRGHRFTPEQRDRQLLAAHWVARVIERVSRLDPAGP